MIERYTIKFGPAVSQKELNRALNDPNFTTSDEYASKIHKLTARIEFIGDFEDVKKLKEVLIQLSKVQKIE
jgi:hypothetical protein